VFSNLPAVVLIGLSDQTHSDKKWPAFYRSRSISQLSWGFRTRSEFRTSR